MLKFIKKEKDNFKCQIADIEDGYFYQISSGRYSDCEVALCQGKKENDVTPLKREVIGYGTLGACKKHAENNYLKRRGILKRKAVREQGRAAGCLVEPYWRPYRED